ncbi:hypothetical protein FJZ53_00125 [Candidatus Woesearchaeota archaeon]|nr:hypothetical protein [Candidatus Woesearchaeota archaeon]
MALQVCVEALIRLFFEIIRVLFGDITLLWRGGYFDTQIPYLISTLKWILFFTILAMMVKNAKLRAFLIICVPVAVNLLIDSLGAIPFIGTALSVGVGIAGAPITALAWAFILWVDDRVHWALRIFATPGIMLAGAIVATLPYFSAPIDIGYAAGVAFAPEIMAFLGLAVIGVIIIISPTGMCSALNWSLQKWEAIRYEGWSAAVFGCLVLIRNKAISIKYKL